MSDPSTNSLMEDLVLLGVIVLGFLGPLFLSILSLAVPPMILSVLLAAGVSALVYRFLGGIHTSNQFIWGKVRLSGSIAALIVSVYVINQGLAVQTHPDPGQILQPHPQTWLAISRNTGTPLPLRMKLDGIEQSLRPPEHSPLSTNPLTIKPEGNHFQVAPDRDPSFVLGRLTLHDLESLNVGLRFESHIRNFVVTERLAAGTRGFDLDPLPFRLDTTRYHRGYSGLVLRDTKGRVIYRGTIYRRQARVVSWNNRLFLVSVVEVNHRGEGTIQPYAKFALGEILARVQYGSPTDSE